MRKDKGTKNLRISLFSYPGENAGIHQEAKQTARNEPLHRLGPSASPAVPHLTALRRGLTRTGDTLTGEFSVL